MAGLTDTVVHAMLDNQLPAGFAGISLHSGDPGNTGANEISGGSPAYARKTVSLIAAASRAKTYSDGAQTFDIPIGTSVAYVGVWISGVFKGGFKLAQSQFYTTQGTYVLQPVSIRMP